MLHCWASPPLNDKTTVRGASERKRSVFDTLEMCVCGGGVRDLPSRISRLAEIVCVFDLNPPVE